ncbi:hypothetical protein GQ53DRAFT_305798 [Thozetella sp. PMI_491]|nr:hypothetical protein GQ53DRAFT_305798 [Thozetella sp. PMI_491]
MGQRSGHTRRMPPRLHLRKRPRQTHTLAMVPLLLQRSGKIVGTQQDPSHRPANSSYKANGRAGMTQAPEHATNLICKVSVLCLAGSKNVKETGALPRLRNREVK